MPQAVILAIRYDIHNYNQPMPLHPTGCVPLDLRGDRNLWMFFVAQTRSPESFSDIHALLRQKSSQEGRNSTNY
jgi:hypothetical protein